MKAEKKGLLKPTLQITALSLGGIALNFLTQLLVAYYFGATPARDAYFAALALPTYVAALLVGSLGVIYLPVFVDVTSKKESLDARAFLGNSIGLVFGITALIVVAGTVFSNKLIQLTAPGFSFEQIQFAGQLQRILLPTIVFQVLSHITASVLQTRSQFLLPAFTPLLSTLIILVVVALLSKSIGIQSLAYGTLLGNAIAFLFNVMYLIRQNQVRFTGNFNNPYIKRWLALSLPLLAAGIFYRLTTVFERGIASYLEEGSLSYLGYANQIMTILATVTSSGIATTLYPQLSNSWIERDMESLKQQFLNGIRIILLICVPIAVVFIFWGQPVFRLLFERGAFTPEATVAVTSTFAFLTGAFLANSLGNLVAKIYYLSGKTMLGSAIEVATALIYLALAVGLAKKMQYNGLALATSITAALSITASFISLYFILKGFDLKELIRSFVLIPLAALLPMLLLQTLLKQLTVSINSLSIVLVAASMLLYLLLYICMLKLVGTPELNQIQRKLYFS
jgi:putative peptidoglycan lipid II flippase